MKEAVCTDTGMSIRVLEGARGKGMRFRGVPNGAIHPFRPARMGEKQSSTSGCRKLGGTFGRSLECPRQALLMVK